MSELPNGWTHFSLKDTGGLSGGKTPSKANPVFWLSPDVPWISPKDMKKPLLETSEDKISQTAVDDAGMALYPKDSVLMVTRSGILQHTFPVALTGAQVTVNQDIKVLRPTRGISPKLSFYMLKRYGSQILSECSKAGTTVQSVDSEKLENFVFPLPPMAEQIRIAKKLDELLTQVDTLKARMDAIPALLKRFRQSVLTSAACGRLTEQWRVDQFGASPEQPWRHGKLPENWAVRPLKKIVMKIEQGWSPKCESEPASDGEWAVIKTTAIQPINFGPSENKKLPTALTPRPELTIRAGDILITRAGPRSRAAVCCYVRATQSNLMICDKAYRFRAIEAEFSGLLLCYFLNSPKFIRKLDNLKTGISESGMNLTMQKFQELELPQPPIEEQAEIVRQVEQLFAFADQLEAKIASAKSRIDHLTQSILAKAFRGELVPQDPNDEPASVLLERIKYQRAAAPKVKRGRKVSV